MQLDSFVVTMRKRRGDAHTDPVQMLAPVSEVVGVENHHVAAVAAATLQVAAGRGAALQRRHHFDKAGAQRQQRVVQPEPGHCRIAVAHPHGEHRADGVDHRIELLGDQAELAQAQEHFVRLLQASPDSPSSVVGAVDDVPTRGQ